MSCRRVSLPQAHLCADGVASSQARRLAKEGDPLRGRSAFAVDESLPLETEVFDPRNTFQTPIRGQEDKLTSRPAGGHQIASQYAVNDSLARGFTADDWPRSTAAVPRQASDEQAR